MIERKYKLLIEDKIIELKSNNKKDALNEANKICEEKDCYATPFMGNSFIATHKPLRQNFSMQDVINKYNNLLAKTKFENDYIIVGDRKMKVESDSSWTFKVMKTKIKAQNGLDGLKSFLFSNDNHFILDKINIMEYVQEHGKSNFSLGSSCFGILMF